VLGARPFTHLFHVAIARLLLVSGMRSCIFKSFCVVLLTLGPACSASLPLLFDLQFTAKESQTAYLPRIVGGSIERDNEIARWQAVFLREGKAVLVLLPLSDVERTPLDLRILTASIVCLLCNKGMSNAVVVSYRITRC
jgi:hypothetical protein